MLFCKHNEPSDTPQNEMELGIGKVATSAMKHLLKPVLVSHAFDGDQPWQRLNISIYSVCQFVWSRSWSSACRRLQLHLRLEQPEALPSDI